MSRRRSGRSWAWWVGLSTATIAGGIAAFSLWRKWQRRESTESHDADDKEVTRALGKSIMSRQPRVWTILIVLNEVFFDNGHAIQVDSANDLVVKAGVDPRLLSRLARCVDLFLVATVADDDSEDAVRSFLEGIAPHLPQFDTRKVVYTSTIAGRMSVARQIDPDIVFEASASNAEQLSNFMERVVLCTEQQAPSTSKVLCASSISEFFPSPS